MATPISASPSNPTSQASAPKGGTKIPYTAFSVIQQGRVIAVIPIHRMRYYKPKRKEKIPRRDLAWISWENQRPIMRLFHKNWIFETEFP